MNKSVIAATLMAAVLSAGFAFAGDQPVSKSDFFTKHKAQVTLGGSTNAGELGITSSLTVHGVGGALGYGGSYNGSKVGAIVEAKLYPAQFLAGSMGIANPLPVEPFVQIGVGFVDKVGSAANSGGLPSEGSNVSGNGGSTPVLSVAGGVQTNTGIKVVGGDLTVSAGYSKLQGFFAQLGLKF